MEPARSFLFIPGNRESWMESAADHGADVIVLDLEDAVPIDEKAEARDLVAEFAPALAEEGQRVIVRPNPPSSKGDHFHLDLEAVTSPALDGLLLPKVSDPETVVRIDAVLTHIERRSGLEQGTLELILAVETARSMYNLHELCQAAPRVWSIMAGATRGADTNQALGFEWTGPGGEGLETVHLREKALLDARAAGIEYPLAGTFVDVEDTDGLRDDVEFSNEMGYTGYVVIHPSQVEAVNEVFTPTQEEVEYWEGVLEAMRKAEAEGKAAIRYEGEMIDAAHVETARRFLRRAAAFEDETDLQVTVDL